MVRLLLAAVLLRILSTAGHQNERLVPSNFDITSVAEKLAQLLASVQTSGMDDNSCAYDVAGNDTEAALKMMDASGKPGSNLMSLMWQWLGDFDECQSIGDQEAHYCLFEALDAAILPDRNNPNVTIPILKFRWGLCVPQQCNASSLQATVISVILKVKSPNIYVTPNDTSVICQPRHVPFTSSAIAVIALCCFIALLVLTSTIIDYNQDFLKRIACGAVPIPLHEASRDSQTSTSDDSREYTVLESSTNIRRKQCICIELFFSFSLVRNVPKLLNTTRTARNVSCLHGIRTLSMMWIILGHCYVYYAMVKNIANMQEVLNLPLQFTFQPVSNGYFSVDSFFFLSGLLVMYVSLLQMDSTSGHFPWIKFYVHRLWRLTPTYAVALLIYWKLIPYVADGPLWTEVNDHTNCDDYWWTNLLYINNFYPVFNKMCMGWGWFLAADTQLYVLSPIVILSAYFFRHKVLGLIPLASKLIAVLITIAVIVTVKKFPADVISPRRLPGGGSSDDYHNMVYVKFYTRAGPYLIGMAVGYYLARRGLHKYKHFTPWSIPAWLAAFGLGVTVVYGLYDYNRGHDYPQAASSLYLTFCSCLWAVCLTWVVYACTSGNGGIVDNVLSWPAWFPLSRLTYSAYLLHPVLLLVYIGSLRQTVFVDNLHTAYLFVAITGLSYACAAILSLCVEYPMAAIEKTILRTVLV